MLQFKNDQAIPKLTAGLNNNQMQNSLLSHRLLQNLAPQLKDQLFAKQGVQLA
jgi:hypothetical protein